MSILEGVTFQELQTFHISLVAEYGVPTGVMVAGNGRASSVCVYGDDFLPALCKIDRDLEQYQDENPQALMIEIVSDEVLEVMNLLLEVNGLTPICEDKFNFSDVLFLISNPVLARQMGHAL